MAKYSYDFRRASSLVLIEYEYRQWKDSSGRWAIERDRGGKFETFKARDLKGSWSSKPGSLSTATEALRVKSGDDVSFQKERYSSDFQSRSTGRGYSYDRRASSKFGSRVAARRKMASWWDDAPLPEMGGHFNFEPLQWLGPSMFTKALAGGPPVRQDNWEGNLVVHSKHLIETLQRILKVRPVMTRGGAVLMGSEDSLIKVSIESNGKYGYVSLTTVDEESFNKARMLLQRCFVPDDPKKGLVYTLANGPRGMDLTKLGIAGSPIERGNYSVKVLEAYDHMVSDLTSESPSGRLSVLAGEPGTGKTFLVRSMLQSVPKAAWIVVPPHMIKDLSGPAILPALSSIKRGINGPIVLILEDGDRLLVKRKDGDMSTISSLLNLGDGILGSVLDIRLVVTTNAKKVDMDPATRRPGRLSQYVAVDALSPERAIQALHRISGKVHQFREPATIAEVYQKARALGWQPSKDEASPDSPELVKRVDML